MLRVFHGLRHFAVAASLAAALGTSGAAGAEDRFFSTIDDLPLMPGLSEDADAGLAFDKPGGRIAAGVATGKVGRIAVAGFYDDVLPSLGWRKLADGTYRRDGETLRLEVVDVGSVVRITATISPAAAK